MTTVIIKTKHSSIEQIFTDRTMAVAFLQKCIADLEVTSYEIKRVV